MGNKLTFYDATQTYKTDISIPTPVANTTVTMPTQGTVATTDFSKDISYKATPVTITSWSYVTTTITLNVASHTFVAGDYIEVSGLTATTYPANGIHLVTSVTDTTIVFTLSATPTGTAGVSSAKVKGYATTNGRVESIGVGQTWQDVTGSRVSGTTYFNTSGRPIEVKVSAGASAAGSATIAVTVGGLALPTQIIYVNNSAVGLYSFIVPPGQSYRVTLSASPVLVAVQWFELR